MSKQNDTLNALRQSLVETIDLVDRLAWEVSEVFKTIDTHGMMKDKTDTIHEIRESLDGVRDYVTESTEWI